MHPCLFKQHDNESVRESCKNIASHYASEIGSDKINIV